jgi:hypothetical protein
VLNLLSLFCLQFMDTENVVLETDNKNAPTPDSPDSSFGVVTRIRTGRSGVRLEGGTKVLRNLQTGCGAHPVSCSMGAGVKMGRANSEANSAWRSTSAPAV